MSQYQVANVLHTSAGNQEKTLMVMAFGKRIDGDGPSEPRSVVNVLSDQGSHSKELLHTSAGTRGRLTATASRARYARTYPFESMHRNRSVNWQRREYPTSAVTSKEDSVLLCRTLRSPPETPPLTRRYPVRIVPSTRRTLVCER